MESIRTIRAQRGLSQRALAQCAGLSFRGLQLLESPQNDARASSLERVGVALGLPPGSVRNDAAKGFVVSSPPRIQGLSLLNLRVWAPCADYMLAMKCVSARFDTHDADDVAFLVQQLGLVTPDEVFERIARYYPREQVPPRTRYLVEELLGSESGQS
ncbi:MAG: hypothetical protein OXG72_11155 [Acidobacteria bacterium]|nr:hypothetical protein [Acidobacteriota bacterium]